MDESSLRGYVEELRKELGGGDLTSEEARERLRGLLAQLERRLEDPDDREEHDTLVEHLKESFERFKLEHPRATSILNSILVSLGEAGI